MTPFDADELSRYGRHFVLPQVGEAGQQRLRNSSVLLVGAGGLGSPVALYLAAAGIGRIGVVDFDTVDLSNLQRQIVHDTKSVDKPKVESASSRMRAMNPHVTVEALTMRLDDTNAREIVSRYDIIVDGSDNFSTRYIVNDACVAEGKPNVHGAVFRFEGQVSLFDPARGGPCYRCLFPEPPPPESVPSCEEGGVLGVLPGIIGTLQASEALKLALGIGESLLGRLILFDALAVRFREIKVSRDPACRGCSTKSQTISAAKTTAIIQGVASMSNEITPEELAAELKDGAEYRVVDVREPHEWALSHLENATHIPLGTLPDRVSELDPEAPTVVYCGSGGRSGRAAQLLRDRGFKNVLNLTGGIRRWAREVDPSIKV
jgi:adenylyltransferase/sulfurtransferase